MLVKVYKLRVWIMLFMLLPFVGKAQLPGLPAGWEFTLNPTSATYAIPTTVAFSGVDALQAGDWVGVFFEDDGMLHCAGAAQWSGVDNIAVVAFGNDDLEPVKNGFADNEHIQWKFFYSTSSEEVIVDAFDDLGDEFFWSNGALDVVATFGIEDEGCEQMFSFTAGYNWLSFNVLPESTTALNDVLGTDGYTGGDFIQTPGGTAEFFDGFGWFGTLANISPDRMYQLNVSAANDLTVMGLCVDVSVPINLASGWNWFGYKPQNATDINTALASMTPAGGDFIQTVGGTAEFFDGFGWFGTLANMAPGKGYQVNLANSDVLVYPEVDNSIAVTEGNNPTFTSTKASRENPNWPTPPVFPNYQMVYYRVLLNGVSIETAGSWLSAWKDDEIRGLQDILMAPPIPGAQNTYPLQMGSELNFDPGFTFKFYDIGTNQVYDILETHDFEALINYGTIFEPIELNCIVPAGTIDICGTVTDAQTGLGIEGALVTATGAGGGEPGNPNWPTPVVFPYYQTFYYMPYLNGVALDQEGTILTAWKDDQIRAIQGVLLPPPIPGAQRTFPLQMGSELTFEPGFTFKVYDIVTDMVYDIEETHDFEALNNGGTIFEPVQLTAIAGGGETYTALTAADGTYCITDVAEGMYTIAAEVEGYLPEEVADVLVEESIVQDFALTPIITCEDASISNFPFADDVCAGEEFAIDFTGVIVENAIEEIWTIDPMAAGMMDAGVFTLNPDFAGGEVTISLLAVAEEPCEDAFEELMFNVFFLPVFDCPEYGPFCEGDEYVVFTEMGEFFFDGMEIFGWTPDMAGTFEITYVYTELETGCSDECTFEIVVHALPEVTCPDDFEVNIDNLPITLTGGLPEGGTYSGAGVDEGVFEVAVTGIYEITYSYTDDNGCENSCSFLIEVFEDVTTISICGTVTDAQTGLGIEGALVTVAGAGGGEPGNPNWPTPVVFPYYQTFYYMPYLNGVALDQEGTILTAWKDDQIRAIQGVLLPPPIPGAQRTFPLQMGSELTFEPGFTFKVYDIVTDMVYDIEETHDFEALNNGGTIFEPVPLTAIAGGGETYTALTAADGTYCITDVAEGMYTIAAEAEGYLPEEVADVLVEESIVQDFALEPICPEPPVVFAGDDVIICEDDVFATSATAENYSSLMWTTSGDGMFDDPTILNATYSPGAGDIAAGFVELCLMAENIFEGCEGAVDCMVLSFQMQPFVSAGNDQDVCEGDVVDLVAFAENYGGVMWYTINGAGEFGDEMSLETTYTPSVVDYAMGSVDLCIIAAPIDPCTTAAEDCITIEFLPLPVVECPDDAEVCIDDEPFEIGGIFFDPAVYGAGVFEFTLTETNECGTAECTFYVIVYDLPVVICPDDFSVDIEFLPIMLEGAMPEGGVYSGDGVVDGMFSADMIGDYAITYTYTDDNGCTNFCTFTVTVTEGEPPVPELVFGNLQWPPQESICEGEAFTAYAQVIIENGTLGDDGYEGLTVEFGIYTDNTDPSSWTNWYPAAYAGISGFTERPEYAADLGDDLEEGTYYYASRFTFMDEVFYGGFDGGFWNGVDNVSGELTVIDCSIPEIVWANVQWPPDGEITFGDDFDVYAQVYIPTITGIDPPNADIQAWIGFCMEDLDPSEFMNWVPATFNVFDGNNNEYMANIGAEVPGPGVYYYASRFQYLDQDFVYGGFQGGFWDGVNNVSGILTVLDPCQDATITGFPEMLDNVCEGELGLFADAFDDLVVMYAVEEVWTVVPAEAGMFDPMSFTFTPAVDFFGDVMITLLAVAEELCEDAYAEVGFEVIALPVAECPEDIDVCIDADPFEYGGIMIDPAALGAGTHEFTITAENECGIDECSFFVTVIALPVAECPDDIEVCLNVEPFEYGGIMIDPAELGVGTHEFTITAQNECGIDECSFFVTVLPLPVIVEQPQDVEVLYGMDAEFTVVAENADAYQWFFEGEEIVGANAPTLTLFGVTLEDEGGYYVEITNDCDPGSRLISITATLTVLPWTQVIDLNGPVNGASTYLELTEDDVATLVAPIMANLQYVEFQRPNQVYVSGSTSFPWTEERGAKIGLAGGFPTSISVVGYPTLGTSVDLLAGWSIMPVWSQDVVLAADVFGPLGTNLIAAFSIDYSGVYWPLYNVFSLEYLVPGGAYLVALAAPGAVDFDVPAIKATPGYASIPANKTKWQNVQMTGIQHNMAITAAALSHLQIGDVIGAFNQNGNIAGMLEVNNLKDNAVLRVYGNEFTSRTVNGFADGDVLTFKVYRNGEVIDLNVTFDEQMPNTNVFAENGLSAIVDMKAGVTSVTDLTADLNVNLYPNPAKDFVNIETNFEIRNLKVVNYVGQVVFDRNVDQISFQLNTSNYGPGMYFVQIQTTDGVVVTRRLTVN